LVFAIAEEREGTGFGLSAPPSAAASAALGGLASDRCGEGVAGLAVPNLSRCCGVVGRAGGRGSVRGRSRRLRPAGAAAGWG
jgi:hypothetical protein